jgi:hypothetical protein
VAARRVLNRLEISDYSDRISVYSTVKTCVVVNEPFCVVMVTGPVVAPAGTVAVTDCAEVR